MTTSEPTDPKAFKDFEHAGWQRVASQYHRYFAELTSQSTRPLLDAVGVHEGTHVLDVATGPGYVAGMAARRGAKAVGVDFSTAQLALARENYPDVEFREGDAEALPFDDQNFDAVVINYGLLHFAQCERALAEAWRVLRSGGRVGFTVWAKPEEAVGFDIVLRAIEAHGDLNVPLPEGPPFFRFSDPDECNRVLLETSFTGPQVKQVPQKLRCSSPDTLFQVFHEAGVRTTAILRAQTPEALTAIRSAIQEAVSAYEEHGVIDLPMPAVLASATKP